MTAVEIAQGVRCSHSMPRDIEWMLNRGKTSSPAVLYTYFSAFLLSSDNVLHRLIILSDLTPVPLCKSNRAVVAGGEAFHRSSITAITVFSFTASNGSRTVWGQCEEAVNNLLQKKERCKERVKNSSRCYLRRDKTCFLIVR